MDSEIKNKMLKILMAVGDMPPAVMKERGIDHADWEDCTDYLEPETDLSVFSKFLDRIGLEAERYSYNKSIQICINRQTKRTKEDSPIYDGPTCGEAGFTFNLEGKLLKFGAWE